VIEAHLSATCRLTEDHIENIVERVVSDEVMEAISVSIDNDIRHDGVANVHRCSDADDRVVGRDPIT
jgi:hypothetical protein